MKPNDSAIRDEIAKLKEITPRVRHYSLFGDDNRAAIDAQRYVLEKNASEGVIYHVYGETDNLRDAALAARAWLDGNEEQPPSEDWLPLVESN